MNAGVIVAIVLAVILLLACVVFLVLLPCKAYFTAFFSGCPISGFRAISMKLRKIDVLQVVGAYVLAKKAHLGLTLFDLETVLVSGGHPSKIVEGMIASKSAKLDFSFDFAKAVDVAGMDVVEVVRQCVSPKVIEMPLITSAARDNREVVVKISLTLKVNLKNFLKGVTDETVSARAVEAVVTKIANTTRASELVSRPELIDKAIFDAGVDADSKYELVSADVIHVDLGADRSLSVEKEQIEKNRILAANQLEQRRLVAIAVEQEMKAKEAEMRVRQAENDAEVPKAIIQAINEGKIKDAIDYYKLENLQADTEMRRKLIGKKSDNRDAF